jgi:predicted amidohydrolase
VTHRVALLQLSSDASENPARRIDRVLDRVAEVAPDADLAVLPELWIPGAFDLPTARQVAAPLESQVVDRLREIARESSTWIHAGSFAERTPEGRTYNSALLLDPSGEAVALYRKRHLFGFETGERTLMSAGEDLVVVDTPLGRTGIATCYDLRFPEMFRLLIDRGATAFLICAGWPTLRIDAWRVLCRARAAENLALVVACNGVGAHADVVLGGRSVVVDPVGDVIAEAGVGEEVLWADIDPDAPLRWRAEFPALDDRLPDPARLIRRA